MPRLEVRADEVDHPCAGVVGARAIDAAPELVARTRCRGADVGVGVMAVDPPGGHDPLGEAVLSRSTDVVHQLAVALLPHRLANPLRQQVERLVPGDALPLPLSAGARPTQRVKDPVGVGDLVEGRRALGAVASPRPRVLRIAFELADPPRVLVDVGQQAARRLAVEAGRRHQHVASLDSLRPGLRIELDPVVPPFLRREGGEVNPGGAGVEGLSSSLGRVPCCRDLRSQVAPPRLGRGRVLRLRLRHASGTACPPWT